MSVLIFPTLLLMFIWVFSIGFRGTREQNGLLKYKIIFIVCMTLLLFVPMYVGALILSNEVTLEKEYNEQWGRVITYERSKVGFPLTFYEEYKPKGDSVGETTFNVRNVLLNSSAMLLITGAISLVVMKKIEGSK